MTNVRKIGEGPRAVMLMHTCGRLHVDGVGTPFQRVDHDAAAGTLDHGRVAPRGGVEHGRMDANPPTVKPKQQSIRIVDTLRRPVPGDAASATSPSIRHSFTSRSTSRSKPLDALGRGAAKKQRATHAWAGCATSTNADTVLGTRPMKFSSTCRGPQATSHAAKQAHRNGTSATAARAAATAASHRRRGAPEAGQAAQTSIR